MAASALRGILFSKPGINNTLSKKSSPCMMAESLLFAPASTLAEPRTITEVSGKPPSKSGNQIANSLGFKFTVGRSSSFQRIQFVDSFNTQQGFNAGNQCDGQACYPYVCIIQVFPFGKHEKSRRNCQSWLQSAG